MTPIVQTILLIVLLAACIKIPLPSAGPRVDLFLYIVVIAVLLLVLLYR